MRLFENAEFELDFSRFKNLEALEATQNKKMKFNRLPPTLRCAKISKLSHENLAIFRDTPKLERLELNFSKVTSLEGIKGCGELEHLSFERCRLLNSAAMQGVRLGSLERLDARFNVENLKFLANFPNLREFYFKYVADGDLTPILEGEIRCCGFESRGHYSHTWNKIQDLLKVKFSGE